jgi:hypothetical protein
MSGTEGIVFAFGALRESGEASWLAQGAYTIAAAGQDFVRVSLVAYVPDQPVARCVEEIVKRNSQLDDTEPGAKVSPGHRNGINRFGAKFVGNLLEDGFR